MVWSVVHTFIIPYISIQENLHLTPLIIERLDRKASTEGLLSLINLDESF